MRAGRRWGGGRGGCRGLCGGRRASFGVGGEDVGGGDVGGDRVAGPAVGLGDGDLGCGGLAVEDALGRGRVEGLVLGGLKMSPCRLRIRGLATPAEWTAFAARRDSRYSVRSDS